MTTSTDTIALSIRNLDASYGDHHALKDVSLDIPARQVTAFIGPSGCGKSTFLRCLNRMNDVIPGFRMSGRVLVDGEDIADPRTSLEALRKKVGMVFQKSNPFPMTIRENVTFGPRMAGVRDKAALERILERALRQADMWEEAKNRLDRSAIDMSGGQQQRLCIARTLANDPEIILMDEPASALDPISTAKIEETVRDLRKQYTIVIVTHNLQQAARCSDRTAFFLMGKIVEEGPTGEIFQRPKKRETEDYVSGKFG
ncbi:MAG: phosphate ABC transporter ATP-binding protein PstB [Planctomycetes bacterium]|nr:phosphate ABC transporter ATP-binding protein PstB [Planctomycetota bacterium]